MTHLIQLHEFDGGIHPLENKSQSTQRAILKAPLPEYLVLPLSQHIGAPSQPIVSVGQRVLKGEMIAAAQGFVSVPLHAPTSGVIEAIEERQVPHASGLSELCIVLLADGKDTWIEHQSLCDELALDDGDDIPVDALVAHIKNSGIAGLGGAGFPTAVKLHTGERKVETLILNGAECEPYITADDMLMREHACDIVRGAQILLRILGAKNCLIGIEDNKPEAIAAITSALCSSHEEHHIDVVEIPTKYPSGGEKQLIQILTGKEVPAGGIPLDLGIVCQNVGTAAAVCASVDRGEPLISRITTVTGDAVTEPGNWEVLLGTPVEHLLNLSGYRQQSRPRVIMGGPMMGFALPSTDLPITKTTNCLLAPTEKEMPTNEIAMACIRCGMCADVCPADLLPQQLYWFSKSEEFEKAEQHNLFDCIECGACSYVCPSQIPLVQYYRYSKGAIREQRAVHAKAEQARERFENRLARQEREQAEKEAKRQARAEAAANAQKTKPVDLKSTAAKEAVAESSSPVSMADIEKLQKQFDGAQAAMVKTKEKLAAARDDESQADKVALFEAALEKTQTKMKTLALELAQAKKAMKNSSSNSESASTSDKGDPNSPERLKKQWETAEVRLKTAQKRLTDAQEQKLETVPALMEGVAKQQARVDEAQAAYQSAMSANAPSSAMSDASSAEIKNSADMKDKEHADAETMQLQNKIRAQKDRVEKAQERLDMAKADNLDT
ncbi:MAG: electron transport complex subunit RsxC, partial [Oleibacter sp.]|nr:electron transport complex subunit RsxC [Thalassolituus sp.]